MGQAVHVGVGAVERGAFGNRAECRTRLDQVNPEPMGLNPKSPVQESVADPISCDAPREHSYLGNLRPCRGALE